MPLYIMVYVAEGTYGCVYRPPIKCKNGVKYKSGKISKLMTRRAAIKEENEYKIIKKADKKRQFYPGPPMRCVPDPADAVKEMTPGECKLFEQDPNISKYELLIYDDGGYDLDKFVKTQMDNYLVPGAKEQTDKFFLNAYNLFQGIKLFLKNDILHHDIKPQNIVFDLHTYRFNYIDFGLIEKKSKLKSEIIRKLNHENFHWSYPLEFGFFNYSKLYYFENPVDFVAAEQEFVNILTNPAHENKVNKYGIKPHSFQSTFRYMENRFSPWTVAKKTDFIKQMFTGLKYYKTNFTFEKTLDKLLSNTDIYSLGFTLNHVLNAFYDKGTIVENEYKEYSKLFRKMCSPNLVGRTAFSIEEYIELYEKVLSDTGVLSRLDKEIKNGVIKDANESIENQILNNTIIRIQDILKACPPGQEMNPATRRCRKVCPPNHFRGPTGRCKKVKVVDLISGNSSSERSFWSRTRKACPPGKELNPATGRCRIACKQGTIRNSKGRCVKI